MQSNKLKVRKPLPPSLIYLLMSFVTFDLFIWWVLFSSGWVFPETSESLVTSGHWDPRLVTMVSFFIMESLILVILTMTILKKHNKQ